MAPSARELKGVACLLRTVVLHCRTWLILFSSSGNGAYANIPPTLLEEENWGAKVAEILEIQ